MEKLSCKERHKKLLEKYIKFIAVKFPATSVFVTCQFDGSITWAMSVTFTYASLKNNLSVN